MDRQQAISAAAVARGVSRLLRDHGLAPLVEFKLGNGRRVDVAALGRDGSMVAVEIKVSVTDLASDGKWQEYLGYCDRFYFAVPPGFPLAMLDRSAFLPQQTGIMVADGYGGYVARESAAFGMVAVRRKAETLRFARKAAARLHHMAENQAALG